MIEFNVFFDKTRNTADGDGDGERDGACNSTCPPTRKSKNVFPELMLLYGPMLPIEIMKQDGDETVYVQPKSYTKEEPSNSVEWIQIVEQFSKMKIYLEEEWNRLRDLEFIEESE